MTLHYKQDTNPKTIGGGILGRANGHEKTIRKKRQNIPEIKITEVALTKKAEQLTIPTTVQKRAYTGEGTSCRRLLGEEFRHRIAILRRGTATEEVLVILWKILPQRSHWVLHKTRHE